MVIEPLNFNSPAASPDTASDVAPYNPSYLWKETNQPLKAFGGDLSTHDYCEISDAARGAFASDLEKFLEQEGLSYLAIPHEEFRKYETGSQSFREWYEQYCETHLIDANFDVCIIGPAVKDPNSAHRKTEYGEDDRTPESNIDYLRAMIVVMKKNVLTKADPQSLLILKDLTDAAEINEDGTQRPRKNYFHTPHDKTRHRSHKTAWEVTVPEEDLLAGARIYAELKIEHEDLMDIDRLTRYFLDMQRGAKRAFSFLTRHPNQSQKMQDYLDTVKKWGELLYDRVCQDRGFGRFLGSDGLKNKHRPFKNREILRQIAEDMKALNFNRVQRENIHTLLAKSRIFGEPSSDEPGRLLTFER